MPKLLERARVVPAQRRYVRLVAESGQRNLPPGGEPMVDAILARIPHGVQRIVDLGCNTGYVAERIARARPDARVVGLDLDPAMVTAASRRAPDLPNLAFQCADGAELATAAPRAERLVIAGSSAFFAEPASVFTAIRRQLQDEGRLIECLYVDSATMPRTMAQRLRTAFGTMWAPRSLSAALELYEDAGFRLTSLATMPAYKPPDSATRDLYRSILRNNEDLRPLIDGIAERQRLIALAHPHRRAVLAELRRTDAPTPCAPATGSAAAIAATYALFGDAQAPEPMAWLRKARPYEFLAYVGDPDAAPGGGRSVAALGEELAAAGLPAGARVLDIGCFTGLSTMILARRFANVLGVDIDPRSVAAAERIAARLGSSARFALLDGGATGFPAGSADAIVLTATLGYTPDPEAILLEGKRVLKPGGLLAEFLYDHRNVSAKERDDLKRVVGPDVRPEPLSSQLARFEAMGFELMRAEEVPLPPMRPALLAGVRAFIEARERSRDPAKTDAEIAEFGRMFSAYSGRVERAQPTPCYRCLFRTKSG